MKEQKYILPERVIFKDLNEAVSEISRLNPIWMAFKSEIDKYPNAVTFRFKKGYGLMMEIDLDIMTGDDIGKDEGEMLKKDGEVHFYPIEVDEEKNKMR